jgi:hypothetical protein
VIRFSAALVAVAIGVLIGGIATSKLLLVYIAIVVSAVALLALATGVVLKREELFGVSTHSTQEQELVPAVAGGVPVPSASVGQGQDQARPDASAPAPFPEPAVGYGAASGVVAQAAPPVTTAHHAAVDPVPPWQARPAGDQWSTSPRQGSTAAGGAPDWMPSGRDASDPAAQAQETALASSSMLPRTPAGPSGAGPGTAPPNWFDRQATKPADAGPPANTDMSADAAPADDVADDDDDWPTRYSWLDDEADEGPGEPDEGDAPARQAVDDAGAIPAPEAPEASAPDGSGQDLARAAAGNEAATEAQAGAATPAGPPASETTVAETLVSETTASEIPASETTASEIPASETTVSETTGADAAPETAEPQARAADGDPTAADAAGQVPEAGPVTVLRGVPRYHEADCVLIRFLPEDDIQRLPVAQAKADGCTPCAACQPAE